MANREERTYNLETMSGIGKKIKLAGREYEVLPVNIADMHYVFNEGEKNLLYKLLVLKAKSVLEFERGEE